MKQQTHHALHLQYDNLMKFFSLPCKPNWYSVNAEAAILMRSRLSSYAKTHGNSLEALSLSCLLAKTKMKTSRIYSKVWFAARVSKSAKLFYGTHPFEWSDMPFGDSVDREKDWRQWLFPLRRQIFLTTWVTPLTPYHKTTQMMLSNSLM